MRARTIATVVALAACGAPGMARAQDDDAARVVRAFVAAFNRHDVPAMLALTDTAIVWLGIAGDSVTIETRGRRALGESMTAYFRSTPGARSTLDAVTTLGPWVSARERAEWQGRTGPRAQSALSVYEVRDGRIRRVWYYPAVR
ncbi:MAG: nuclear transport factor 2 family protein [Gemmatirosa sp.]